MTTYVKIETFKRSTGPGTITNKRVVIPEGTDTAEALKTIIKEAAGLTVDSDELIINGVKIIDDTVDLNNLLNVKYNAYLVERDNSILENNERAKSAIAAKLTEKYPVQAATYRAARIKNSEYRANLNKNRNK